MGKGRNIPYGIILPALSGFNTFLCSIQNWDKMLDNTGYWSIHLKQFLCYYIPPLTWCLFSCNGFQQLQLGCLTFTTQLAVTRNQETFLLSSWQMGNCYFIWRFWKPEGTLFAKHLNPPATVNRSSRCSGSSANLSLGLQSVLYTL